MKDIVIIILGLACLLGSLLIQPMAEMGFGMDPKDLPHDDILAKPLADLAASPLAQSLRPFGDWAKEHIGKSVEPDDLKATLVGDYSYALVMAGAMIAAAIAIALIGKEEAEEKTILPVKK